MKLKGLKILLVNVSILSRLMSAITIRYDNQVTIAKTKNTKYY